MREERALKPITYVAGVLMLPSALWLAYFPIGIAPRFALLFHDFGDALPPLTALAVKPWTSLVALGLLLSGLIAGVVRRQERTLIWALTAGFGFTAGFALMAALYLPLILLTRNVE